MTATGKVGIGTDSPAKKLDVAGDINTSNDYNIGGSRVLSVPGTKNVFAGVGAGGGSPNPGDSNSFFGSDAGLGNYGGSANAFFGSDAGHDNFDGSDNAFFGSRAGHDNYGSFGGSGNAFFGSRAGERNGFGYNGSFFGASAGGRNTFGRYNVFIGEASGFANTIGEHNTVIGTRADVASSNLTYATAIGAEAVVSSSNTIALGRADGSDTVDVPGKLQIDMMGTTGGTPLCLNGSSRVAFCNPSSLRYKTQVQPFLGGLNIISGLRPISFTWKEDGARDLGLGAEEVERVEPLLTFRNKQGEIEGVKYNQLSAVLINAIKEQQQQIQELKREIVSFNTRVGKHHRRAIVRR